MLLLGRVCAQSCRSFLQVAGPVAPRFDGDHEKVFKKQMLGVALEPPTYEFLTQEELDCLMEDTTQRAKQKLKMTLCLRKGNPLTMYCPLIQRYNALIQPSLFLC